MTQMSTRSINLLLRWMLSTVWMAAHWKDLSCSQQLLQLLGQCLPELVLEGPMAPKYSPGHCYSAS